MSRCLKVVLVHRYFAPDTPPYAHILESIAQAIAGRGHDVRVLTCQPSYNRRVIGRAPATEAVGGVTVTRFPVLDDRRSTLRKIVNLGWYCLRLGLARRAFKDADVVMAATTPPVMVARVCSWLARRGGARFVYHKQDVWPEVLGRSSRGLTALRRIDHGTELDAAAVVVLSEDMAETVQERGGSPTIKILNNFDPWVESVAAPASGASGARREGLTLVFAGNLGRFQGLEHVQALMAATAAETSIEWHVFGDGPLRSEFEQTPGRVTMHGHRPPEEVAEFVRTRADLGVISLNPGVIRSAYPSKTMTYLRNGCPVLALVESDSELAALVRRAQIGVTAAQDDTQRTARRLVDLARDRTSLESARDRAVEVYEQNFGRERQLSQWCRLIEEVAR